MIYRFEDFSLDGDRRELRRGNEIVALEPKVFDVLEFLIVHRERVVSNDDLIQAVWQSRIVSDGTVSTRINAVRHALGDSGALQRLIRTIPRKGYRFAGEIRFESGKSSSLAANAQAEAPTPLERPSIAVLPFANFSGDAEQNYFADGMVDEIITALSRIKWLFVIARTSSFTYRNQAIDVRQVGRELGVRYVLEGSVRKAGNRVRITGQLVDAASGLHLWADRFESDLADIFELQDHVTSSVVGAIAPSLELAEINRARGKVGSLVAYDYYLRSLAAFYRFTRTDHEAALCLLQTAIELDPEFALAHAIMAHWYHGVRKSSGWDQNQALEKVEAERLAQRALELDRSDPRVLANVGATLWWGLGRYEEGASFVDQALEIDPNYALAWGFGGGVRMVLGRFDESIEYCERALRLSPLDPRAFIPTSIMASAHFLSGRYDEAVSLATKALRQHRGYPPALQTIVASHAMAGRIDVAEEAWALYLRLHPTARMSTIRDRLMFARNEDTEKYATGFRRAGMPE